MKMLGVPGPRGNRYAIFCPKTPYVITAPSLPTPQRRRSWLDRLQNHPTAREPFSSPHTRPFVASLWQLVLRRCQKSSCLLNKIKSRRCRGWFQIDGAGEFQNACPHTTISTEDCMPKRRKHIQNQFTIFTDLLKKITFRAALTATGPHFSVHMMLQNRPQHSDDHHSPIAHLLSKPQPISASGFVNEASVSNSPDSVQLNRCRKSLRSRSSMLRENLDNF